MKRNKLDILCETGFPLIWYAPKSDDLTTYIKIIREKQVNNMTLCQRLVYKNVKLLYLVNLYYIQLYKRKPSALPTIAIIKFIIKQYLNIK